MDSILLNYKMWTDFRQIIFPTILVLVVGFIYRYVNVDNATQSEIKLTHPVTVKFERYAEPYWTNLLKDILSNGAYYKYWKMKPFTEKIAYCQIYCSEQTQNADELHFDHKCLTHPLAISDTQINADDTPEKSLAEATAPCIVKVDTSTIPEAGYGVIARYVIPEGFLFGPYQGVIHKVEKGQEDSSVDQAYSWAVNYTDDNGEPGIFEIDGSDESQSNWLRYINTARYEEEQNMVAIVFDKHVYYVTYKDVQPGAELLIWYGKGYAHDLNIRVKPNSNYFWYSDVAPPMTDVLCPSCPETGELLEDEQEDDEEDHR